MVGWLLFMYIHRKLMPYPLHFICMHNICNACTVDTIRYLYCYPFVLISIHTYWYDVVWLCCGTILGILICRDCNKTGNPFFLYLHSNTYYITIDILFSSFLPFVATSHYFTCRPFVSKDALNEHSNNKQWCINCVELSAVT